MDDFDAKEKLKPFVDKPKMVVAAADIPKIECMEN